MLTPPAGLDLVELDRASEMIRNAFRIPPEFIAQSYFTAGRSAFDALARLSDHPRGQTRVTGQI